MLKFENLKYFWYNGGYGEYATLSRENIPYSFSKELIQTLGPLGTNMTFFDTIWKVHKCMKYPSW